MGRLRSGFFAVSLVLLGICSGPVFALNSASPGPKGGPIQLVQATQVGQAMFAAGDTDQGGTGQTIDGIQGSSSEMFGTHIHAHLSLFYQGQQIAIPYGIGIVKPFYAQSGFVGAGRGFYWIHTHDASGIIHIESPDKRKYTLGNFFDIWGEPLNMGDVAGLTGELRAYVDGAPYFGDPRNIVLARHAQITLEVGKPFVVPPVYIFPKGM